MSVVKSGSLRKHSKSILHGGWNRVWVILYKDSNLVVFKKQGDSSPMGTINMVEVKKWFAYGDHTNGMPDRPQPPAGCSINQIIGIPEKPSSKAKVHWFLADNDAELHAWMEAICSTLPPPPEKQAPVPSAPASVSSSDMIQAQHSKPVSSGPPYPGGPAPSLGFDGVAAGPPMPSPTYQHHTHSGYRQPGQHPQQGPYPQAPPQQGYYGPPTPAAYPQQPQGAYPQQPGYPQAPPHYAPPPGSYPQQPYYAPPPGGHYPQQQGYQQQQGYHQGYPQQPTTVVYQNAPQKKGGFMNSTGGKIAMGAALGYGASQMMGGGMYGGGMYGGGFGWGHGSWSSLSSFGSFGSCGSFGSWD